MEAPGDSGRVVPVFPLPNVWLFPSVVLPLHVFEPRYRELVEDSLDGPGRMVLGTIVEGHEHEAAGAPPFHSVAGLGEIGRHEKLADGRFNLLLVGLARVFVREVESDRPYRKVEWRPAPELSVAPERADELRTKLLAALASRAPEARQPGRGASLSHLADLLLLRIPLPHAELHAYYAELDVERRARALLEEHETAPPPGP